MPPVAALVAGIGSVVGGAASAVGSIAAGAASAIGGAASAVVGGAANVIGGVGAALTGGQAAVPVMVGGEMGSLSAASMAGTAGLTIPTVAGGAGIATTAATVIKEGAGIIGLLAEQQMAKKQADAEAEYLKAAAAKLTSPAATETDTTAAAIKTLANLIQGQAGQVTPAAPVLISTPAAQAGTANYMIYIVLGFAALILFLKRGK